MKNYIRDFVSKYDYPDEAVKVIEEAYRNLSEKENFNSLLNNYYNDESINVDGEKGPLYSLSSDAGVNFFTAKLVFYICLSRELKQKYAEKGFGEDFWFENMADLKVKMMECFDTCIFMEHYRVKQVYAGEGWDENCQEIRYRKIWEREDEDA